MTAPQVDLANIVPLKYKTWVGGIGALLTFIGPFILQSTQWLPTGPAAAVGVVFALLTTLGIYKAPYKPAGTTLAIDPNQGAVQPETAGNVPVAVPAADAPGEVLWSAEYKNPWK